MKIKVGIVTSTNKSNKIGNIIRNFKQQIYFNKKLFLVINKNDIDINDIQKQMFEYNILYEIICVDEKFNLGYCLNKAIKKLKEQNYDIFAKFDDDDIYEKKYLLEQIYYLNKHNCCIVGKYNIPLFIPEYNNFYNIKNFTKNNQFAEICRGSTIMFNINDIKHNFDINQKQGIDSIFLKQHINNGGKIYVTSFNNYIWIRYLDKSKHTWKLNISDLNLIQITDTNVVYNLYNSLLEYKFIDVSQLLVTVIVTMYNSSKTIEKCLLSMLEQSHKNMEIIVVDDCSSDNSIKLVESFIQNNKKIRLIKNEENRGTYYCKNLALQSMNKNTKYIAFQDSDDYSHQERIRKQIEVLYLTNGKLSVTLCKRYNVLRFACISQVYDIEIFNKLGYFDNSRFGADSEYLYRFFKLKKIKLYGNYNYDNGSIFKNRLGIYYCIPSKLYIINSNDHLCLSNLNPLNSKKRIDYKNKYIKKINNSINLYYNFSKSKYMENLNINWSQKKNIIYLHLNKYKFYIRLPFTNFNIENTPDELKEYCLHYILYGLGFNKKGKNTVKEYPDFFIKKKQCSRKHNNNIGLCYSNGIDSGASLVLLPKEKTIPIFIHYNTMLSDKSLEQFINKRNDKHNFNALNGIKKIKELDQFPNVYIIESDIELIRHVLSEKKKRKGWNCPFGHISIPILLAEYFKLGSVALGGVLESKFLKNGHHFKNSISFNISETEIITGQKILNTINLDLFWPVGGLSEVLTSKIVKASVLSNICSSCTRGDDIQCFKCIKCFRKLGFSGKLMQLNTTKPHLYIKKILNTYPVKMATSTIYACQKNGYSESKIINSLKNIDISFVEKYYKNFLYPEKNEIHMVPKMYKKIIENNLKKYGIEPMNEKDIKNLQNITNYFDNPDIQKNFRLNN